MKTISRYLALISPAMVLLFSFVANAEFKAGAPADPDDVRKYGFGSLIKDKDTKLKNLFNSSSAADKNNKELKAEKVKVDEKLLTKKDKLWNTSIQILKDFPIESMDKKAGTLETEEVMVNSFDSTGACLYKIKIEISNRDDVFVKVESKEDSPIRLKEHEKTLKNKILEAVK